MVDEKAEVLGHNCTLILEGGGGYLHTVGLQYWPV